MQLDPAIAQVLALQAEQVVAVGGVTMPARGDALGLRALIDGNFTSIFAQAGPAPEVSYVPYQTTADDGATIDLRWYTKVGSDPGSAIVYIHGGGLIGGSVELYDQLLRAYVNWSGVPLLAVDTRLAPEVMGTTTTEDSFTGLLWLVAHASELGVDAGRVAIMGDSGGGAPAAGAAILARDRGIHLKSQLLIYPMLDDRNTQPDPQLAPTATWTYDNNYTGWHALLGDAIGTDRVSPIAAPSRNTDFHGLAPAYIEVGDMDIFRDESLAYAQKLLSAGVSTELHVHSGAPHAYDWLAFSTPLGDRWRADRIRVIQGL
jgi:acetyl esterase/lipase